MPRSGKRRILYCMSDIKNSSEDIEEIKEIKSNSDLTPERLTLTFYDRKCETFGVSWYTAAYGSPEIRIMPMPDGVSDPDAVDASCARRIKCASSDGMEGVKNVGIIDKTSPERDYFYMVGDAEANVWSRRSLLRRRVPHDDSFTFLFFSDTQDGVLLGTMWKKAYGEALRDYPETAFTLHGGDIVDYGGYTELWEPMLRINAPYTMRIPMMQASGNHEYWPCYLRGNTNVDDKHYCQEYPPQDTTNGVYFAREFGNALFLVMNSGDVMSAGSYDMISASQLEWLERELSSTDKDWRIVMIHNPLYSPGKYGSAPDRNMAALNFRRQLNGLFWKYKVSLCLCGHDHVYFKTYPIDKNGKKCAEGEGTVHVMPGCGGIQNRSAIEGLSAEDASMFEEYYPMRHGHSAYMAFKVTPEHIDAFYYTVDCEDPSARSVLKSRFTLGRRK